MKIRLASTYLVFLTAAACGGSDGDDSVPRVPDATGFKITSSNAEMTTGEAWRASNESADFADLAVTSGLVSATPGGFSKASAGGATATMSLLNYAQKVPFGPQTLPCQVSGAVTLSGDVADPTTLTAGDFINVDADNCDDGLGDVIDGLLEMTIDGFTGDLLSGAYELTMTIQLSDFQVTTADDVETGNGDVTVTLNTLSLPAIAAGVSGNSITTDFNSVSRTLSDFVSARTLDAGLSPAPYTLNAAGMLESTELPDGELSWTTPVTFEGLGAAYPHTGELLVSGDNSSARLTAIDDVNVRIDVDTDGNGTVDTTIETTWAELATF